jgi:hypothetical protein
MSFCFLSPTGALAQSGGGGLTQQVTVLVNGVTTTGLLTIRNFSNSAGQLTAMGTLSFTDPNGIARILQVRSPVTITQAECEILSLDLGPIDLNLLGLEVHVDEIHIDIVADPSGGLLGQLLCSIANIFNGRW